MNRPVQLIFAVCLQFLVQTSWALAPVKGEARASIFTQGNVWVGQQVQLDLDVQTTGFSFSDLRFSLPELSGAFLMQTDSTTIKLSETRRDESWQIIRYPLALFPLQAGTLNVPAITVRFSSAAGFGSEVRSFELKTRPLKLDVQLPPGATPGEIIISTANFEIEYDWNPQPGPALPGDAFTLTVTRRAEGISAMLLPPLPAFSAKGLGTYVDTPDVNDHVNRGNLTGVRTDTVTWVAEQAGSWALPDLIIQWWDPVSTQLEIRTVKGFTLEVSAPIGENRASAKIQARQLTSRDIFILASILFGLALLWFYGRNWLRMKFMEVRTRHVQSEKFAYRELRKACREGKANRAYEAVFAWLKYIEPDSTFTTLTEIAVSSGDASFLKNIEVLQKAILDGPKAAWDGKIFEEKICRYRKSELNRRRQKDGYLLPSLNPRTVL